MTSTAIPTSSLADPAELPTAAQAREMVSGKFGPIKQHPDFVYVGEHGAFLRKQVVGVGKGVAEGGEFLLEVYLLSGQTVTFPLAPEEAAQALYKATYEQFTNLFYRP